jgi:hypothetical protein
VLDGLANPETARAMARQVLPADLLAPVEGPTCPGCSGEGLLTDDPQVLKCTGCGGVFTDSRFPVTFEQAMKFVALGNPMLANAGPDGSFYFDLDVALVGGKGHTRRHGWADRATKRVVQWG